MSFIVDVVDRLSALERELPSYKVELLLDFELGCLPTSTKMCFLETSGE